MYFGIAHLLGYPVSYTQPLYRFADFNAGWYASRNAAFQNAVSRASGIPLALDGDLVRYGSIMPGSTEAGGAHPRQATGHAQSDDQGSTGGGQHPGVREQRALSAGLRPGGTGRRPAIAAAVLPGIVLQSPKITRKLTTAWFAKRVDERYQALHGAGGLKSKRSQAVLRIIPGIKNPTDQAGFFVEDCGKAIHSSDVVAVQTIGTIGGDGVALQTIRAIGGDGVALQTIRAIGGDGVALQTIRTIGSNGVALQAIRAIGGDGVALQAIRAIGGDGVALQAIRAIGGDGVALQAIRTIGSDGVALQAVGAIAATRFSIRRSEPPSATRLSIRRSEPPSATTG